MWNHNDILITIAKIDGHRCREALILKERINGTKWERFTTGYDRYACGYEPPHYPVPAIPVNVSNPFFPPLCVWDKYRSEVYYIGGYVRSRYGK